MSRKNFTNDEQRGRRIPGACKRNFPRCEATGKIRYRERKDAKQALGHARHVRAIMENAGVVCRWNIIRAYKCGFCKGWHTTSKELFSPEQEPKTLVVAISSSVTEDALQAAA
ncbi:hypothetical protein [Varibaculum massiliense]|uniref:hypothetical protein n=1 Tax=Varibaculum massiliense TaxID=1852372 RepID=UPI00288B2E3D|nr:hypothetical protein [Varibaculum massiliense]